MKKKNRIDKAVKVILNEGNKVGSHDKQYASDQALRILTGRKYDSVVVKWKSGEEETGIRQWGTGGTVLPL